jgi:hypothetical protein
VLYIFSHYSQECCLPFNLQFNGKYLSGRSQTRVPLLDLAALNATPWSVWCSRNTAPRILNSVLCGILSVRLHVPAALHPVKDLTPPHRSVRRRHVFLKRPERGSMRKIPAPAGRRLLASVIVTSSPSCAFIEIFSLSSWESGLTPIWRVCDGCDRLVHVLRRRRRRRCV